MDATIDLEKIIREELALATRFKDMLAKRGLTYKVIALPMERPSMGGAITTIAGNVAANHQDVRSDVADHGANKQKVLDAIRDHAGETYNAVHISTATGLSISAVRQVFRRLPMCGEDFIVTTGQGRRPTVYSKAPKPGTLSASARDLTMGIGPVTRISGNGHAEPKEEAA